MSSVRDSTPKGTGNRRWAEPKASARAVAAGTGLTTVGALETLAACGVAWIRVAECCVLGRRAVHRACNGVAKCCVLGRRVVPRACISVAECCILGRQAAPRLHRCCRVLRFGASCCAPRPHRCCKVLRFVAWRGQRRDDWARGIVSDDCCNRWLAKHLAAIVSTADRGPRAGGAASQSELVRNFSSLQVPLTGVSDARAHARV
jgi:hypothetical protein